MSDPRILSYDVMKRELTERQPQWSGVLPAREHIYSLMTLQQAERFWDRVSICSHGEECRVCCWEWQGSASPDGYGLYGFGPGRHGKRTNAHRFMYLFTRGDIPLGLLVCHTCDRPSCVNPAHLWLGTHADNHDDRNQKGRTASGERHGFARHPDQRPRGERHGRARLTEHNVLEIRRLGRPGVFAELGRRFGVTKEMIGMICRGQAWKHLLPKKERTNE